MRFRIAGTDRGLSHEEKHDGEKEKECVNGSENESPGERAIMMHRMSVAHPDLVQDKLYALRQQIVFNELMKSCMSPELMVLSHDDFDSSSLSSSNSLSFEIISESPSYIAIVSLSSQSNTQSQSNCDSQSNSQSQSNCDSQSPPRKSMEVIEIEIGSNGMIEVSTSVPNSNRLSLLVQHSLNIPLALYHFFVAGR